MKLAIHWFCYEACGNRKNKQYNLSVLLSDVEISNYQNQSNHME